MMSEQHSAKSRTVHQLKEVLACLRELTDPHDSRTDASLLALFVEQRNAEAFATILRRHGPMVHRICRSGVRDSHTADDAFQATFLILARQAASIKKQDSLASWLHGTALRVASNARRTLARQPSTIPSDDHPTPGSDPATNAIWNELQTIIDEEIQALPTIYREAFVRCGLEQEPCVAVAHELGLTESTIRNRLMRARQRLQIRLDRRGVTLSATAVALAACGEAAQAFTWNPQQIQALAQAAATLLGGHNLTELTVSQTVLNLVNGVQRVMLLQKLKWVAAAVMLSASLGIVAFVGTLAVGQAPVPTTPQSQPKTVATGAVVYRPPVTDLGKLQGTWYAEKENLYYVVTGSTLTIINSRDRQAKEYHLKISEKKEPRWFDLHTEEQAPLQAIYLLQDDKLTIANATDLKMEVNGQTKTFRTPRPLDFNESPRSTILNFKRITKVKLEATMLKPGESFTPAKPTTTKPTATPANTEPSAPEPVMLWPRLEWIAPPISPTLKEALAAREARLAVIQSQAEHFAFEVHYHLPNSIKILEALPATPENLARLAETRDRLSTMQKQHLDYKVDQARIAAEIVNILRTLADPKQLPLNTQAHPVTVSQQGNLQVPIEVGKTKRDTLKELRLFATSDNGKGWQQVATAKPSAWYFDFKPEQFGELGFAVQLVNNDGNADPASTQSLTITLRLNVTKATK